MAVRLMDEYMAYYKNRILSLIIYNPGKYGTKNFMDMFGLGRDTIQEFIGEYGDLGFKVRLKEGKYMIDNLPRKLCLMNGFSGKQNAMERLLYNRLEEYKNSNGRGENKRPEDIISELTKEIPAEGIFINKLLEHLQEEGLICISNKQVHIVENPFRDMGDSRLLKLLIFINVMKDIYPRNHFLNSAFIKLKNEYERRGMGFDSEAVNYRGKSKMKLCDEIVLKIIEEALYNNKSIEFTYRTQVGRMNIKINPSGLIYNCQKNMWYVVTSEVRNTEYRIDKITDINIEEGRVGEFKRSIYECSMGISSENIVEVRAAFEKEGYIYKKLSAYIKLRKCASINETDSCYILRDKVCGTSEFKKWLRSFGKSAVCLKPDSLREEMIKEIKLLRERYGVI